MAVIARKRSGDVTDRQTDGQTEINNPPFFLRKASDSDGYHQWIYDLDNLKHHHKQLIIPRIVLQEV